MSEMVRIQQLNRSFGGVQALTNVSLTIQSHAIYGLIGPNGAGKTTLFNVLTGLIPPSSGQVFFAGKSLAGLKPHQILQRGIARTFQNIRLFAGLSVLENVMIGRHARTHAGVLGAIMRDRRTRAEEAAIHQHAEKLLAQVGISHHRHALAANLSYGDQRRLEIARALASEPQLLALDEPAAGMNPTERDSLRELIVQLHTQHNLTVLIIEHDVNLMMRLCDRIAVLDFGQLIAEGTPEHIRAHPSVINAYLGSAI